MKILDIPQSGKRGITVSQGGRYGQISRALVIPTNPRTGAQMLVRSRLAAITGQWRQLTDAQQEAWIAAAKNVSATPRTGTTGALTGSQLFTKINASLLLIGSPVVTDPPANPGEVVLPLDGLEITNTAGAIAIKIHSTAAPPPGTVLRAAAPASAGTRRPGSLKFLGTLGAPAADGYIDITSAYTGCYGAPAVGTRVCVAVNTDTSGWQGIPVMFSARVPAAA
jgi:hypothetical protein